MTAMQATTSDTDDLIARHRIEAEGWSRTAREDALARATAMGLPQRRDEYWKYTRPDSLTAAEPVAAALLKSDEAPLFDGMDRLKLVFVDGVFDTDASDDLSQEGLEIELLSRAEGDLHWARDLYGALEARGQKPVERPLAAVNTAFAKEGVLIRVTGKVSRPVNLISVSYTHLTLPTNREV